MPILPSLERVEGALAPYAQTSALSRGRRYPEAHHGYRSLYQRDRDRIVHARAFRRLEYKTQVFVNHEGDHYRTRLTHSIEVSQIGRTVARALGLNEDLVESLALSHDLGHTPFGHLGEDVLDELMKDHGGFDHNRQTLRIVEQLEERYPDFPGLNLTWEVREGIAKHSGPIDVARAPGVRGVRAGPPAAARGAADRPRGRDRLQPSRHRRRPVVGTAGRRRARRRGAAVRRAFGRARATRWPQADPRRVRTVALRGLINVLVTDLIEIDGVDDLESAGVATVDDVRDAGRPLAGLSPTASPSKTALSRPTCGRTSTSTIGSSG